MARESISAGAQVLLADEAKSSARTGRRRAWRRYGGPVSPRRLIDRLRTLDPRLIDALIALALAALIVVQFAFGEQPGPEADVVNLITGPLLALTLVWRRRAPLAMICAFAVVTVTNEALGGGIFSFSESGRPGGRWSRSPR